MPAQSRAGRSARQKGPAAREVRSREGASMLAAEHRLAVRSGPKSAGGFAGDAYRRRHGQPDGSLSSADGGDSLVAPLGHIRLALIQNLVPSGVRPPDRPGRIHATRKPVQNWRVVPRQHRAEEFPRRLAVELDLGGWVLAGVVPRGFVISPFFRPPYSFAGTGRSATTAGTARPSGSRLAVPPGAGYPAARCPYVSYA